MSKLGAVMPKIRQALSGSRLRRNIGYTLGRQLLVAAAQLLLVVLIARALGPEGNGHYAMAILLPTLMVNLLNLGVAPATVYFVGRGELAAAQASASNLRFGLCLAAIGVTGALLVVFLSGEALFPGVPQGLLLLGLVAFPVSLLLQYLNSVLQGLEDFRAFNAATLIPPYVALAGVALALFALGMGTRAAVIAYLVGQSMGLVAVVLLLKRKRLRGTTQQATRWHARKIVGYGWKAHLSNVLAFVNYRADIFLVNLFLTPAATGVYVIAVQIAERLWMLSKAASTVLLPRLSAMHDDPAARLRLTQRGFLVVLLITAVAGGIGALALHCLLEPVFGAEYANAMGAFLWLLPGIIFGAGARVQSNCIAAAGKPEWNMYVSILVVTTNIILNIFLIPLLGMKGAAIATSAAYIGNAVVKMLLVQKTAVITSKQSAVSSAW